MFVVDFLRRCLQRDRAIFRSIQRAIIYPLYRYEHYRLKEVRAKMESFTFLEKKEMLKEGEWKWVYVIKQEKKE
jgi:hypothetical protein